MTNKLPEVGKRYKRSLVYSLEYMGFSKKGYDFKLIHETQSSYDEIVMENIDLETFWKNFEELSESTTDTINQLGKTIKRTKELVEERENAIKENYNCGLGDEVEMAKEELKQEIIHIELYFKDPDINSERERYYLSEVHRLRDRAQYLINALDKYTIPEKKDCGITNYTIEEKPQSIWKDNPDTKDHKFLVKLKNGKVRMYDGMPEESTLGDFRQYCTLTDFVNHIESIEERLRKLEEKDK